MSVARCLPRFRQALRAMEILREREQWSRAQIAAFQLDRLNRLWRHAIQHVPYFVNLARDHHLPAGFSTIEEFSQCVPLMEKAVVKQDANSLVSDRPGHGHWKYTGGSTGTPASAFWSNDAHRDSLRAKYRFQQAWGVNLFDRTVFLWGHGCSVAPGWSGRWARFRQPYLDRLRNRLRLSAMDVSRASLRGYLERIRAFKPAMIYGYSRALYLLAMEARREGKSRPLTPSLKLVVATSEPAWPHMIEMMEQAFGAPVAREYGAAECGIMATEAPDRILRVREDQVLIETLPRDDGWYDIVVTVLTNRSFPLIRYDIGDVTSEPLARPDEGFAILSDVGGRDNDLLRSKAGEHLHWVHIENAIAATAAHVLRRFSVHQGSDGSVAIDVELHDPSAPAKAAPALNTLRAFFDKRMGGYPVTLHIVDRVKQTVAGKHRIVSSDLYDLNTSPHQSREAETACLQDQAQER